MLLPILTQNFVSMLVTWFYMLIPMLHTWFFLIPKVDMQDIFIYLICHQHTGIQIQNLMHQFILIVEYFATPYLRVQNAKQEEYFLIAKKPFLSVSLEALNHPQPATPVKTDNSVAFSFSHANIRQRKSKTWDMNWNWLRDKQTQKIFRIYWKPGAQNHADYWTKHHSPTYHARVRSRYVLNKIVSFPTLDLHCIVKNAVLHSQSCVRVCWDMDGRTTSIPSIRQPFLHMTVTDVD